MPPHAGAERRCSLTAAFNLLPNDAPPRRNMFAGTVMRARDLRGMTREPMARLALNPRQNMFVCSTFCVPARCWFRVRD
jgi:hypothetical protein